MSSIMATPNGNIYRQTGSGTTSDPLIMWLVAPPSRSSRLQGNEQVARDLGRLGYTDIWIRHCDHQTTRVTTRRRGRRMIPYDNHITVYCGQRAGIATRQGGVFLVVQRDGIWRIMMDRERSVSNGRVVELYPYPSQRQG